MTSEELETLLSTLYHALRTKRRRLVIQIISGANSGGLSTSELARKITSEEMGVSERHATGEPYRNAYNALSQTHLPTLDRAGIVIYDPKRQMASRGDRFELAALLLATNTSTVDLVSPLLRDEDSQDNK